LCCNEWCKEPSPCLLLSPTHEMEINAAEAHQRGRKSIRRPCRGSLPRPICQLHQTPIRRRLSWLAVGRNWKKQDQYADRSHPAEYGHLRREAPLATCGRKFLGCERSEGEKREEVPRCSYYFFTNNHQVYSIEFAILF
jgi:hypothetical protein